MAERALTRVLRQQPALGSAPQIEGDLARVRDEAAVVLEAGKLADGVEPAQLRERLPERDLVHLVRLLLPVQHATDLVAEGRDLELVEGDHGLLRGRATGAARMLHEPRRT
jgi:hypothetical protein